jgi:hypothetical protein
MPISFLAFRPGRGFAGMTHSLDAGIVRVSEEKHRAGRCGYQSPKQWKSSKARLEMCSFPRQLWTIHMEFQRGL